MNTASDREPSKDPSGGTGWKDVLPIARLFEQGVELSLSPTALTLTVGVPVRGREEKDLGRALGERFGAGAFGPGRLSAMVDFGELLRELEVPREIPGVDPERLASVQSFSASFFKGIAPVDFGYVDVEPGPHGGRIRARVHLRQKK